MNRLLALILATLTVAMGTVRADNRAANSVPGRPSLLLAVTINGLDYNRLSELLPLMGNGGFKRLIDNGVVLTDINYGSVVDDAAATAMIFTGASPAVNGITGKERYDSESRRVVSILDAPEMIGNYTDETLSPAALRVSTIGDEIRLDANGLGNVHAIAPDPAQAIISAGHAANSAVWITDTGGKWATTTYYKELPLPIQSVNQRRPLYNRLDTLTWLPALSPSAMTSLPSYKRIYQFRHSYSHNDPDRYRAFKLSAPVNTEITDLAVDYLQQYRHGTREPLDMLALTYTLQPYLYSRDGDTRAETIDAYLKLDSELARLLKAVDTNGPATSGTVITVVGTPLTQLSQVDDPKWGVPTGTFSPERAVSLLKVYLMSVFGNGDWVTGYHDRQFFLNRRLIKERSLKVDEVASEAASFLRRMSGVTYASTLADVVAHNDAEGIFPPARNIDVESAGDLFISVAPGWVIESRDNQRQLATRAGSPDAMAIISAPRLQPAIITEQIDVRRLTPTIARLLNIRVPSGATLSPVRL